MKGPCVNLNRTALAAGLVVGAMALTACGSDNNKSGGSGGNGSSASASSAAGGASSGTGTSAPAGPDSAGGPGAPSCVKGSVQAEGSTAQKNAIGQWIKDYQGKCDGSTITYNPTGSGSGIKNFTGGQVDFAGSDSALDPKKGEIAAAQKRCGSAPLDLPMVVGPIAIAYNVKGLDNLILTPTLVARMFQGKIKTWDDPAIKAANPGAKLPSSSIKVIFRSEESGTTQNFEKYLAAAAPSDYKAEPSKSWSGSVGEGKKGSDGVQQAIQSTDGAIGYVEWSFAQDGGLQQAKIDNGGGAVALTGASAGTAVAAAKVTGSGNDLTLSLDYATKAKGAYPIILVTYEVVCTKYSDAKKAALIKSFLSYTSSSGGQQSVAALGYAPLPTSIQKKVIASVGRLS